MNRVLSNRNFFRLLENSNLVFKRLFLSEAFKCTEAWDNRLKNPIFKKIVSDQMFSELDKNFATDRSISALDVDLFVNGLTDSMYDKELQSVLYNLRLVPETSIMYESTGHAAIRWYLANCEKEELFNILGQRLEYGIFPDIYLSVLMIDKFLKENDYISAVKVAVLQMLQEDCNHPILKGLSIYSCIKYLNSSAVWITPKETVDEDEDVVKIRVRYARNEYYDDHFDIINTNHLVGKTLVQFGKAVDGPLGISSQIVGLVLYEKYGLARELLTQVIENNTPVYEEAVEKAKSYLTNKPKQEAVDAGNEKGITDNVTTAEDGVELEKLLNDLDSKVFLPGELELEAKNYCEKEVSEHETSMITKQCEIYKRWEKERDENIEQEQRQQHIASVKAEIEQIKKELEEEELRIFYFDNENEYNIIEERNKYEKDNVRYFVSKEKSGTDETTYVPPQVKGTRN